MRAVLITQTDPTPSVAVVDFDESLLVGDTLIAVEHSTINFKDAMVTMQGNRVARQSPLIGGVDLAGTILECPDPRFPVGSSVIVHGHQLGVARHGGFAERARVDTEWVIAVPPSMSTRSAMIAGTAGFTAMASMMKIMNAGIQPGDGPILVTGATGGVGSASVLLLAQAGYEVVASSGKRDESEYLESLGAERVIGRDEIDNNPERTLGSERWAAAIDCVGGPTLTAILRSLRYGGVVAASGLTAGSTLETTVFPFIVRAVSLLGIDAVEINATERQAIWNELGSRLSKDDLERILDEEITLDDVPQKLEALRNGFMRGRVLITPDNS